MSLQPDELGDFPTPSEIVGEIGWVLALHLALAVAIVLTVQGLGVA